MHDMSEHLLYKQFLHKNLTKSFVSPVQLISNGQLYPKGSEVIV